VENFAKEFFAINGFEREVFFLSSSEYVNCNTSGAEIHGAQRRAENGRLARSLELARGSVESVCKRFSFHARTTEHEAGDEGAPLIFVSRAQNSCDDFLGRGGLVKFKDGTS
jgi:hypothetical protein